MLESIFITLIAMGFVLFILAIEKENVIYCGTSILMWILVMAGQVYIEVAGESNTFNEPALLPVAIGFIFVNILWLIVLFFDFKMWRNKKMLPP